MDVQGVLSSLLKTHLTYCLKERLALDVAYGTAYLCDHYIGICLLSHIVYEAFYLICDIWDYLHCPSQILAVALLGKHVGKHFAGGEVGKLVQVLVDEPLVMAQVKVGLGAVLGDIYLSMLVWAHCSRVHVDVRIKLLGRHLEPSCLQKPS